MDTIVNSAKVIYTAYTHTTGGRQNGVSRSSDGRLDVKLSSPGSVTAGTNPEQLFAAGWSACFEGAMSTAARRLHIQLADNSSINAEIDLCIDKREYYLRARLNITIPGIEREMALRIIEDAQDICPYSKALRHNVNVKYNLL